MRSDATPAATEKSTKPRVVDTIRVGPRPHGIAVAGGSVWVVTSGNSKLVRIDAGSGRVAAKVDAGERPGEVAVARGRVYVTAQDTHALLRFSDKPRLLATRELDSEPEGLAVSGSTAWVASTHPGLVTRIGRRVTSVPSGGEEPVQLRLGDVGLWVADAEAGTVILLDPTSLQPLSDPIAVGQNPRDVLERNGDVWVVATGDDRVRRIPTDTLKVDPREVRVDDPQHIAAGDGALWVTDAKAGTVSRIEPSTSEVTTVRTGGKPLGIAYGAGAVWVSDFGSDRVWRIDPDG